MIDLRGFLKAVKGGEESYTLKTNQITDENKNGNLIIID